MRAPSYLQIVKDPTPKGWEQARLLVSFKPCRNCGAKCAALSDPCGFEHLDMVLQFSADMQSQGFTIEDMKAMKEHFESTKAGRR